MADDIADNVLFYWGWYMVSRVILVFVKKCIIKWLNLRKDGSGPIVVLDALDTKSEKNSNEALAVVGGGGWWSNTMQIIEPSYGPVWPHIQKIPAHHAVLFIALWIWYIFLEINIFKNIIFVKKKKKKWERK